MCVMCEGMYLSNIKMSRVYLLGYFTCLPSKSTTGFCCFYRYPSSGSLHKTCLICHQWAIPEGFIMKLLDIWIPVSYSIIIHWICDRPPIIWDYVVCYKIMSLSASLSLLSSSSSSSLTTVITNTSPRPGYHHLGWSIPNLAFSDGDTYLSPHLWRSTT